ncbi:transcription antitermination factor NusB [Mycoplasma zalophi]|uniref:Transcription antitermination protein NusB n=2 Tax=Mycoplasma zalophi TaxID=191287 RepID=A0ABS6DQ69_9MOLU|nr:transcription antitermination factor NusB [Mycoplasma zalophi]MBU4691318.1 transcription antitermination protein NusB [Mycoplasma zalophi]MBU4692476.1 transcription antitermination protein NusB [Mycoplasma zalophi]
MNSINKIKKTVNFSYDRMQKRMEYITVLYQCELFKIDINTEKIFNDLTINENKVETIEKLKNTLPKIKNLLQLATNDRLWEQIEPLVRAILIYGVFEMSFNDPALVINEMINITKIYSPGNTYKFVNSILDKFKK